MAGVLHLLWQYQLIMSMWLSEISQKEQEAQAFLWNLEKAELNSRTILAIQFNVLK